MLEFYSKKFVYRGFHKTFDKQVSKFIRNFRSYRLTWQFDHFTNLVTNFATRLGTTLQTLLRLSEVTEVMADLENWLLLFRDKLDQNNQQFHSSNSSSQPVPVAVPDLQLRKGPDWL